MCDELKPCPPWVTRISTIELPAGEYKINGEMRTVTHCFKVDTRTQPPQQGGDVGEALARLFDCVSTKARGQVTRQNQTDFETIHAYLTQAQEQQTAVIPEGYALVPLKPTEEAITAGMLCDYKTDSARRYLSHQYTAMIAATIKQAEGE